VWATRRVRVRASIHTKLEPTSSSQIVSVIRFQVARVGLVARA